MSSSSFSVISSIQAPLRIGTFLLTPHSLNKNSFAFHSNLISFLVLSILSYFLAESIISSISSWNAVRLASINSLK